MSHTIDANVFVPASMQTDVFHADSAAFLTALRQQAGGVVCCPALILPEVVAAVARPTGQTAVALQGIRRVTTFPGMRLVSLTAARAERAAELAAIYRLRGADAVYLAVAEEFGATLVTWDGEMRTRGAGVVTTLTPAEWLAAQTGAGN